MTMTRMMMMLMNWRMCRWNKAKNADGVRVSESPQRFRTDAAPNREYNKNQIFPVSNLPVLRIGKGLFHTYTSPLVFCIFLRYTKLVALLWSIRKNKNKRDNPTHRFHTAAAAINNTLFMWLSLLLSIYQSINWLTNNILRLYRLIGQLMAIDGYMPRMMSSRGATTPKQTVQHGFPFFLASSNPPSCSLQFKWASRRSVYDKNSDDNCEDWDLRIDSNGARGIGWGKYLIQDGSVL